MERLSRRDFIAASAGTLASIPALAQDNPDLVVHEWGVVSVAYGSTVWGNARSAGAKAMKGAEVAPDLPPFVSKWEDHVKEQIQDWRMQPVDKPVVYFYANRSMDVSFKVSIPAGRPKAWWPPTADWGPGFQGRYRKGIQQIGRAHV